MERMMMELKTKMENSNESSSTFQTQLGEAQASIRTLEDDRAHLQSKVSQKDKELEELNDEIRKLHRQFKVLTSPSTFQSILIV